MVSRTALQLPDYDHDAIVCLHQVDCAGDLSNRLPCLNWFC